MRALFIVAAISAAVPAIVEAGVTRLQIDRREVVLNGRPFGAAGPYEKLSGKVHFALDPALPQNRGIVDLDLAPQNAQGLVEFSADFYLLKPVDPGRGNGRLFYEAGNRGTKRILPVFQDAANSADPTTAAEFGNGALMRQGYTLLWMGWQWDVPEGRMRMDIPIATDSGTPITGWCAATSFPAPTRPRRSSPIAATGLSGRRSRRAPNTGCSCARCRPIRRARFRGRRGASPAPARSRSMAASRPAGSTTSSTAPAIRA